MGSIIKNGINYSGSGSGGSGVSSYTELTDKPSINNVTLTGNKTTADLGIVSDGYSPSDTAETTIADGDYFPFQDVSADGKRKTLWSNIKSVLKTYFDSLYQKTLTAGTNITISNNTISALATVDGFFGKSSLYSTTEKVVGCWTDGRPLYQRTYSFTTPSSEKTWGDVLSISSSYSVKNIFGYVYAGNLAVPFPYALVGATQEACVVAYQNGSYIKMWVTYSAYAGVSGYMTIQYTKTSDSANSFNYASVNDYSTSEKIVGTWTNGANLYQRTYTGTVPSSGSDIQLFSISGMNVVDVKGYTLWNGSSGTYFQLPGKSVYSNKVTESGFYCYNNYLYLWVADANNYIYGRPYTITLQYTK